MASSKSQITNSTARWPEGLLDAKQYCHITSRTLLYLETFPDFPNHPDGDHDA